MENTNKDTSKCPVDAFLKIIGQRWNTYILHILIQHGPLRFGALKKQIPGISQKVLTTKLRELELFGFIHREHIATIPPTVIYSLKELGKSLQPLLTMISDTAHRLREKNLL